MLHCVLNMLRCTLYKLWDKFAKIVFIFPVILKLTKKCDFFFFFGHPVNNWTVKWLSLQYQKTNTNIVQVVFVLVPGLELIHDFMVAWQMLCDWAISLAPNTVQFKLHQKLKTTYDRDWMFICILFIELTKNNTGWQSGWNTGWLLLH